MKRHEWEFKYLALDVLSAAEHQMQKHEAEAQRLLDEASERVLTNDELAQIARHDDASIEYSQWVHVLQNHTNVELSLDHEDVLYFWPDVTGGSSN